MGTPRVMVVPYPAQGHVIPMLELSLWLVKHGIKVTFVNTHFNHQRVVKSLSKADDTQELMTMLEALVERINENGGEIITCVTADWTMGWALEVAEKLGPRRVAFWSAAAAVLALFVTQHPKTGKWWDYRQQRKTLDEPDDSSFTKYTYWLICNSSSDLEPGAFSLFPDILPVGPLLASNRLGTSVGHFWPEEYACLVWMDQQPPNSVIYVAFGSFTAFDPTQFENLAHGLELTNRAFLWVARQDITTNTDNSYPKAIEGILSLRELARESLFCAGPILQTSSLTRTTFVMSGRLA
ncbi:hypothetical protein BUALT_Bualt04G0137400 [Buddleja alternifolia]|uniref:Glycosyltransferase N-terminal domain-containing protein n=1 Tax=Buddleja alternifolia TaxID=168488 RepID=A0AAV6XZG7_9LAMI|nr:hypothetical protein BUALT_Bualt04G0137400 [Buddleja alternifolia]